ncbi:hypothetical protein, partial [Burkholderia pseudomallei]|uniref:hypothetical protein n=1 Tax=Burkholderia pseudomallei TaxID=28450 RepID=UPI0021F6CBF7
RTRALARRRAGAPARRADAALGSRGAGEPARGAAGDAHIGTSAHRHIGTSAHRHIGTSAHRHIGTSTRTTRRPDGSAVGHVQAGKSPLPLAAARVFARRNMPACPPAAFRLLPAARGWTENDACLWRVAMSIANRKPQTANR